MAGGIRSTGPYSVCNRTCVCLGFWLWRWRWLIFDDQNGRICRGSTYCSQLSHWGQHILWWWWFPPLRMDSAKTLFHTLSLLSPYHPDALPSPSTPGRWIYMIMDIVRNNFYPFGQCPNPVAFHHHFVLWCEGFKTSNCKGQQQRRRQQHWHFSHVHFCRCARTRALGVWRRY